MYQVVIMHGKSGKENKEKRLLFLIKQEKKTSVK